MEVVDSAVFNQFNMIFEGRLKRSLNSSNFSDFPSIDGIVVVSNFGTLEIMLILL